MLDWFDDIPAFVAAAEAGGFAAAAHHMNLSRSAVGKAVARLEGRLGVRLFHRTTRRQSLTEDRQAFYERCQSALGELQAGRAQIESGRVVASGKLRVSMPVLFGRMCVAPALTQLARHHPGLELDLQFSDRVVDLAKDGFDLAVRMGEPGAGAGLMVRRVAQEQMRLYVSPAYLAEHGAPNSVDQLPDHQAISYARNGRVQIWRIQNEHQPTQDLKPVTRLRFDDLDAIADAAANGFGLAWLPSWLVSERVREGSLVAVLSHLPPLLGGIYLVWPETPYLPTRVRVAIDALASRLPAAGEPEDP